MSARQPVISLEDVQYWLSETNPENLGSCAAEIAFVGRSNVGKSTLLNVLCRKKVARVSSTPGCTRAINVFLIGRDRWLVDLPGYGYAKGPEAERASWAPMIEKYLTGRPTLRMVFSLIDAKVGPTPADLKMFSWLEAKALPWRAVATKSDQVPPSRALIRRRDIAREIGLTPERLSWVSAEKNIGVRELRTEAESLLTGND